MTMHVPFVDLAAQHASIRSEIDHAFKDAIDRSAFVGGEQVRLFEEEFARYCDVSGCVGVGNGTDALYLAMRAMGIGSGDEVITVAHTFVATSEAITSTGAHPVFVDIDEQTLLIDPTKLEAAITPRTKAIIPVHIYGHPCPMDRISEIARKHSLWVIEDAAQAQGAKWQGRTIGSLGDVACFSFYPSKNLGAMGDAGAVVSDNADLLEKVRMLSNHGRKDKYLHAFEGVNSRLDGLQAAVLRIKLRHLDEWNDARRHVASLYRSGLEGLDLVLPPDNPDCEDVWHLFVVRVADRDQLAAALRSEGIDTGVHYPVPLHRQPAYEHLGMGPGSLPVTERAAEDVLSLPMFAHLTDQQVERVIEAVRAHLIPQDSRAAG